MEIAGLQKANLTIRERLGLGGIIDKAYQAGGLDLEMLKIAGKLMGKIKIEQEEQKKLKWKVNGPRVEWNEKKDKGKKIELTSNEIKFIKDIIKRKNEGKEFAVNELFLPTLIEKLKIEV